jgi:TonB family protein
VRFSGRFAALLLLTPFLSTAGFAQSQPPGAAPAPLPKDPSQLMQLAWQQNGLHGDDLQPWHLRATWQMMGANGHPSGQGSWEMWWAGEKKYKIVMTAPKYQQTRYVTDRGEFVVSSGKPSMPMVAFAPYMLLYPVPNWDLLTSVRFQILKHKSEGQKLICVAPQNQMGVTPALPQYCFSEDFAAIRLIATSGSETIFNSFVRFQDRYVARDIQIVAQKRFELDLHVESLDLLGRIADGDLTPPPGAVAAPQGKIAVASGVMAGNRIAGDVPEYPILAMRNDIQGTVVLEATIEKDGTVGNLSIVSGPPELQEAALAAVRTWRYFPYLLNGQPVTVRTQVNVVFNLRR